MNIPEIIFSLIGFIGAPSIISGLILRRISKLEETLEKRDRDRVLGDVAQGDLLHACGKLAEANTAAIRVLSYEEACETEFRQYKEAEDNLERLNREKFAEYVS